MNRLQKILSASLFPLTLVGCGESPSDYVEGEVAMEIKDDGYKLFVDTNEGVYLLDVIQSGSAGNQSIENLALVIKEGTVISFPTKYNGNDLFSESFIGSVNPDDIEVLK